jgi:CRP-like cAMP-binding protein
MKIVETMNKLRLFKDFSQEEQARLSTIFRFKTFEKNAFICKQGAKARGLSVIISGEAEALSGKATDPIRPSTSLGPNCLIGLVSMMDKGNAMATVIAATPVQILYAKPNELEALMDLEEPLGYKLMDLLLRELSMRQRKTNEILRDLQVSDLDDVEEMIKKIEQVHSSLTSSCAIDKISF